MWYKALLVNDQGIMSTIISFPEMGRGSSMELVVSSTPLSKNKARKLPSLPLTYWQKLKKVSYVVQGKGVSISQYKITEESGLSKLMFIKMSEINLPLLQPKDLHLDILWHALCFNPKIDPEYCPGWNGYMSIVSRTCYSGKLMIHMLPIIDLDSNCMPCIYSNLSFIIQQSQVTFDQSIRIKANKIVHENCINKVLILGGLHTMISLAGSIDSLMNGSGLAESLETC